ncbi:uncharacterized protein LOC142574206 [Dermacentor variabilis]|uniref:uncharacterized protein LOC142574206 n=1 Tax=Dermacentor variabilis TaxID=34621 RepID=UPI003F5C922D
MRHPWILAMHILRDYLLLVVITSPGSLGSECRKACLVMWCPDVQDPDMNSYIKYSLEDPDDEFRCARLWCPAVKQVSLNKYLCRSGLDPELATTTTATTEVTEEPEEPTTRPAPPGEEQKPADKYPVSSGQPTAHEEETVGLRVPWVGYYSEDCRNKDGSYAPNGKLCLVTPDRRKLGTGHGCYWGNCQKGRCVNAIYSRCATM